MLISKYFHFVSNINLMKDIFAFFFLFLLSVNACPQKREIIYLWPGKVPGELKEKQPPSVDTKNNDNIIRFSEVTNPAVEVFMPDPAIKNGSAVIVCPGGGYQILAYDLEGTEIAAWLNKLGYTAFVLQYRIPGKKEGALQDAQRAIRIVKLPVELHLLPSGGHGYGLRPGKIAAETWPLLAEKWLTNNVEGHR
jgi:acetyl esterase/lipase